MLHDIRDVPSAITYIRACLERGNSLAKHLLRLPLEQGQVAVPLAAGVPEAVYSRFAVGGVTARKVTEPQLTAFVAEYLEGEARRYAIFEDALARPGDAILAKSKASFLTFDSEVLHVLTAQERDPERILGVVRLATSYLFLGVLSSLDPGTELRAGQALTADMLAAIAQHTDHLLIGAYDNEGVLIWSRRAA